MPDDQFLSTEFLYTLRLHFAIFVCDSLLYVDISFFISFLSIFYLFLSLFDLFLSLFSLYLSLFISFISFYLFFNLFYLFFIFFFISLFRFSLSIHPHNRARNLDIQEYNKKMNFYGLPHKEIIKSWLIKWPQIGINKSRGCLPF